MADVEGVHLKITGDSSQAVKEIEKTQQAVDNIKDQTIKVNVESKVDDLGNLNKASGQFMTMGEKLASSFSSGFMKKAAEWSTKLDTLGKVLETRFSKVFKTITAGVTAVSGSIALVAKNALSIGGDFESQITNVKVISGATEEELDMLIQKAREMGANLPITAKDAATAMELLAQRGTKTKDILASVADVSSLAISQSVDMGSAADLLGSTMTNFSIAIENASKVTDIFNNASNQSALNMSKLIEAMKYVGPAAGSVGMELTEAISAMEVLANSGLSGEMIGTGLSMTLSRLAKEAQVLGVKTKNLDGTMRPLRDIFSELQAKGFSLADASNIFGERAAKAALNLAKYSSTLADNEKNLQQWGSTQAAVTEKMKTWQNVWGAFQSASEELHIEIFMQIKEQSKEAVSGIADLTREFSKWINETRLAGKSLNAFLEGLGFKIPSSGDFKKLLESLDVQPIIDKFKSFGSTIKSIGNGFVKFYNLVKVPLTFLIKHIEAFATISFWGWLIGKGLQVPIALINIASAFTKLKTAIVGFKAAKGASILANLMSVITSPITWGVGLAAAVLGTVSYIASLNNEAKKIQKEKEKIQRELQEQAKAGEDAKYYVDVKFKTGFEDLPAEYNKASEEVRKSIQSDVLFLQEQFRNKTAEAVNFVKTKFPEIANSFNGTAGQIEETILTKISKSLQGSEEDFKSLSVFWQRVTERINAMNMAAGQGSYSLVYMFEKYKNLQREMEKMAPQNEVKTFNEEISRKIEGLVTDFPANLERLQKFLGGQNLEVALDVSLSEASKKLEDFTKSASEKFYIPEEIVQEGIFNRLQKLAAQGNKTAQTLSNGLQGASSSLNNFIQRSEDAINYLGASPEKFTPTLNKLAKSIQKIDPITGKVTEQFKKAYDTLKQWSSITFDRLSQQIQRLKKAVEGGFIDKSALEAEFKRVSEQVKLQIVTELEPTKNQYSSRGAYESVVASEYVSKMQELGGDIFLEMIKKEFSQQTGADIGHYIVEQISRGIQNTNVPNIAINGNNQDIPQTFSNVINPLIAKIEQIATPQSTQQNLSNDYSSAVSTIVGAIREVTEAVKTQKQNTVITEEQNNSAAIARNLQNVSENINSLKKSNEENFSRLQNVLSSVNSSSSGSSQDLSSAISPLLTSTQNISSSLSAISNVVSSLENIVKSMTQGNTYNIDINQQGFVIQQKSDADTLARSTVSALRSGFGNGGL